MNFRGVLALLSIEKTTEITKSGVYNISVSDGDVEELKIKSQKAFLVFHDLDGFFCEVYDESNEFLYGVSPEFDSLLNIQQKDLSIRVKIEKNIETLHFSVLLFDDIDNATCDEIILSTDASSDFNLTGFITKNVKTYQITKNNKVCYWISSPNIKNITVDILAEATFTVKKFNQSCFVTNTKDLNYDDFITIKSELVDSPSDFKIFNTQFFDTASNNIKNGLAVKQIKSSMDSVVNMKSFSRLTIRCINSTAIVFHSFKCTIKVYDSTNKFICVLNETNPGFKFGNLDEGKVEIFDNKEEFIYFSALVLDEINYENVYLTTELKDIVVNPHDSCFCYWVSSLNSYSIKAPNSEFTNYSVTLFNGTTSSSNELNVEGCYSTLVFYSSHGFFSEPFSISLNKTNGEESGINFTSIFNNFGASLVLHEGDCRITPDDIVIDGEEPFSKTIEIPIRGAAKLNITASYMSIFIHNTENIRSKAIIKETVYNFNKAFSFAKNTGIIEIESLADSNVYVSVAAMRMNCSINIISNDLQEFLLVDPSLTSEYTLPMDNSMTYCYWFTHDHFVEVVVNSSLEKGYDILRIKTADEDRSFSDKCLLSLYTNNALITLTTDQAVLSPYLNISAGSSKPSPKEKFFLIHEKQNSPCELNKSIAYNFSVVNYMPALSGDYTIHNNGKNVYLDNRIERSFIVIHDKGYTAQVSVGSMQLGVIDPSKGSFGACFKEKGTIMINTELSEIHFTVVSINFKSLTCTRFAVSTAPSTFSIIRSSKDSSNSRNFSLANNIYCYLFTSPVSTTTKISLDFKGYDIYYGLNSNLYQLSYLFGSGQQEINITSLLSVVQILESSNSKQITLTHTQDSKSQNEKFVRMGTTFLSFDNKILVDGERSDISIDEISNFTIFPVLFICFVVVAIVAMIVYTLLKIRKICCCCSSEDDTSTSANDIDEYRNNINELMDGHYVPQPIESNNPSDGELNQQDQNLQTSLPQSADAENPGDQHAEAITSPASPYTNPYAQEHSDSQVTPQETVNPFDDSNTAEY